MSTTLLFNEVQFLADIIDNIATLPMKYPYDYVFPETKVPALPKQSQPWELKEYKSETQEQEKTINSTDSVTFTIKALKGGVTHSVTLPFHASIVQLKKEIAPKFDIPPEYQRLVISGKALSNDKSIADYPIKEKSTVHLLKLATPVPLPDEEPKEKQVSSKSPEEMKAERKTHFLADLQKLVDKHYKKDSEESKLVFNKLAECMNSL
ncbi:hypothetical protein BCR36DRAFT_584452 [Piromyces finnis]|uniref:Ubiquitin-like domain-containing protein n=1 Tax=Piromyces finnis TaxID=1754191 RepID=A0A1Y1V7Z8_9FUNG|nr:hypothetical protein BCR36DRAFT_584452 [Piromyces finnis]|eukprot:ORX48143.1 hypothetical protein BCR36DRAFT_584452 [Piromyces finnis]